MDMGFISGRRSSSRERSLCDAVNAPSLYRSLRCDPSANLVRFDVAKANILGAVVSRY
jgi:hypothetical protein